MEAKCIEYEIDDDEFRDYLDGIFGDVDVCGFTYGPGYALQELDPTAFRCAKLDYESEHGNMWQCSKCDEVYDTEAEAEDCCTET